MALASLLSVDLGGYTGARSGSRPSCFVFLSYLFYFQFMQQGGSSVVSRSEEWVRVGSVWGGRAWVVGFGL